MSNTPEPNLLAAELAAVKDAFAPLLRWLASFKAAGDEVGPRRPITPEELAAADRREMALRKAAIEARYPDAPLRLAEFERRAARHHIKFSHLTSPYTKAAVLDYFDDPSKPNLLDYEQFTGIAALNPGTQAGKRAQAFLTQRLAHHLDQSLLRADAVLGTNSRAEWQRHPLRMPGLS